MTGVAKRRGLCDDGGIVARPHSSFSALSIAARTRAGRWGKAVDDPRPRPEPRGILKKGTGEVASSETILATRAQLPGPSVRLMRGGVVVAGNSGPRERQSE